MNDVAKGGNGLPEKIALCLSGGGYRAAGYHLGTLDYLDHLGLRDKVTMLSTVSGGTFVGTSYVVSLIEKKPFSSYFADSYTRFRDSKYVKSVLRLLGTERPDRPGQHRNMIQAAAEHYATSFLSDSQGRPILMGKILTAELPLTVIFNTTCFYSGENFVFQKGSGSNVADFTGTWYAHLSQDDAKNVRLADIAAASSCFPIAFEPLGFPDDFVWPGEIPALHQYALGQEKTPPTIPLMDGGVADNVGLNSLVQALPTGEVDLDLIIASDVDHKPIDLYKDYPLRAKSSSYLQRESRSGITVGSLNHLLTAVVAFLGATIIGQGISLWREISSGTFRVSGLFFPLMTILLAAVVAGEIAWVRRLFRTGLLNWFDEKMGPGAGRSWDDWQRLAMGQVINMAKLRISSLIAMTQNVFMRCIRQLTYDMVQNDPRYNPKFITDMIYLIKDQQKGSTFDDHFLSRPSPKMMAVVDAVVDMNSTLWWEKEYQLPCLAACGQISLCLSLVMHYRCGTEPGVEMQRLLEQLRGDWNRLNDNPYALLEQRYPLLKPFPSPSVPTVTACENVQTRG